MGIVTSSKNNTALNRIVYSECGVYDATIQLQQNFWNHPFELDLNFEVEEEDIPLDSVVNGTSFYRFKQKNYVHVSVDTRNVFFDFDAEEWLSKKREWYSFDAEKREHTFGVMPLEVLLRSVPKEISFFDAPLSEDRIDFLIEECLNYGVLSDDETPSSSGEEEEEEESDSEEEKE